jgi:foldase protein PrsA
MSTGKKGTSLIVAVVLSLVVAGPGGYMAGHRSGEKSARLAFKSVATVNDEQITQLDLYERLAVEGGQATLDGLVTERLIEQAARDANVTITPDEVDKEIAKIRDRIGGEDAFQEAMAAQNLTLDRLKGYTTLDLKITKLLTKDLAMDDTTLQTYFQTNINQFDTRQVHARHILVSTVEEATAIKAELDAGADFDGLARARSTEPGAAESGGDLGYIKYGDTSPAFEAAAYSLNVNEISEPVQTEDGWHVIQLIEVQGEKPNYEDVKEQVTDAVIAAHVNEQMQPWLEDLRQKAKISTTL